MKNLFKKPVSIFIILSVFSLISIWGFSVVKADTPTPSPITVSVWADNDLIHLGETVHLQWESFVSDGYNITQCNLSADGNIILTSNQPSDSFDHTPLSSTTYAVNCYDDHIPVRNKISSIWVAVGPSPTITITPTPADSATSNVTVSWSAPWADSCVSSTGQGGTGKTGTFITKYSLYPQVTVTCTRNAIYAGAEYCSGSYNVTENKCIGEVAGSVGPNGELPGPYEGDDCVVFSPQSNCPMGWINHPCHWGSVTTPTSCYGLGSSACAAKSGCLWTPAQQVMSAWTSSATANVLLTPVVSLSLDQTQIKNVVKKGVAAPIGTAYLIANISNLNSGGCKLKKDGVEVDGIIYGNNNLIRFDVSSLLAPTNNFQLDCTNSSSPSLRSAIVSVKTQSADLAPALYSCTIPVGGSSCPNVAVSGTVVNPKLLTLTSIKNLWNSAVSSFSGATANTYVAVPAGVMKIGDNYGTLLFEVSNFVDGEDNTASAPTTSETSGLYSLDNFSIDVACDGSVWNGTKCEATTALLTPTGQITTPDCTIPLGSGSCPIKITWDTQNPATPLVSEVRTPNATGTLVATGNTSPVGGFSDTVPYGIKQYSLVHNLVELDSDIAWADCDAGLAYNNLSKKCESTTNTTGVLNATNCTIPTGASTCSTKLTWSTSNPKLGVTSNVTTPTAAPTGTVITTGNNSSLPFSYSMSYGARKFYLNHNNVPLSNKTARATCSAFTGDVWNGTICAKPTTGSLTATNCVIQIGASSCMTDLVWTTTNPIAGLTSQVTTPNNVVVGTGNNNTKKWPVEYGSRNFYLYHNGEPPLDRAVAMADCDPATAKWDGSVCIASAVLSPDLVASNPSPISAVAGVATTYKATITNQGNSSTLLKFANLFQTATGFADPILQTGPIDLKDYPDGAMPALGAGASAMSLVDITFPVEGNYYMRVCADKDSAGDTGAIAESDESNNCSGSWSLVKVVGADVMFGTLTGNSCTIASGGNNCNTTLNWSIDNTESVASEITANSMTSIVLSTPTIGNDYSGTKTATVPYPNRTFYLYNNAKSLVPVSPGGIGLVVSAVCTQSPVATIWDGDSCEPVAVNGICGATHNDCISGTSIDETDSAASYLWTCKGNGIGTNASCSEAKILPIGITFTATPDKVLKGRSSILTWSAENATSCTSSDFDTNEATENLIPGVKVTPTSTKTYNLTCTNGTSSPSSVATVTVVIPVINEN